MSGGSLVNLAAKGVAAQHLTGTPECSFWRSTWRRHTNHAHSVVELRGIGTHQPNGTVSYAVPRKGDLLSYVFVDTGAALDVGSTFAAQDPNLASQFRLSIGGQVIEEFDAFYATRIFNKYLANGSKPLAAQSATAAQGAAAGTPLDNIDRGRFLAIPFNVSCDSTMALPLVALSSHEIEIQIRYKGGAPNPQNAPRLFASYVHLDTEERTAIAKSESIYLINQVQKIGPEVTGSFDLSLLNHPTRAIFWGGEAVAPQPTFESARVQLNGNDVTDPLPPVMFNSVQSYFHTDNNSELHTGYAGKDLYCYSFALRLTSRGPSGSANFSRLDQCFLRFDGLQNGQFSCLYAINWNLLKCAQGLGGILYSS